MIRVKHERSVSLHQRGHGINRSGTFVEKQLGNGLLNMKMPASAGVINEVMVSIEMTGVDR